MIQFYNYIYAHMPEARTHKRSVFIFVSSRFWLYSVRFTITSLRSSEKTASGTMERIVNIVFYNTREENRPGRSVAAMATKKQNPRVQYRYSGSARLQSTSQHHQRDISVIIPSVSGRCSVPQTRSCRPVIGACNGCRPALRGA